MTSGSSNAGFYACGTILLLVCALKLPALARRRHDTLLRAACLLLFVGGCEMILVAPASITTLNRLTGIANIAAPVAYCLMIAFSGTTLVLIINWRPAPTEQTRRVTRVCVTAYGLAVVAVITLFRAGHAPVEQVTLFDVYYANTPCIRELIVIYLVAQGVAMAGACTVCWRWSKDVHGSLEAGLRILACAYLLNTGYDVVKLVAVAARWTGHDLDFLAGKVAAQLGTPVALLGAIGFTVPLAGPRVAETARAVKQLRQLRPLWRALRNVPTPGVQRTAVPWLRTPPAILLTARRTALYDAILALSPYCDPAVREAAYQRALRNGDDESRAAAIADAAMLLVARNRQRTNPALPPAGTYAPARRAQELIPLSLALASPVLPDLLGHPAPLEESSPS
ncbi:MAB_1171c family putative transporter [Streptomyces sp. NPDC048491]|uniref:MAB_1171c family putative transporter n=1 Tax=Streptomyces sp. NPDC048491 TaxID=3157207 RepID=UPI003436FE21